MLQSEAGQGAIGALRQRIHVIEDELPVVPRKQQAHCGSTGLRHVHRSLLGGHRRIGSRLLLDRGMVIDDPPWQWRNHVYILAVGFLFV
jgi:hypothetical protein